MTDRREHWSDCAVHNAPALEPRECDCGGLELTENALDQFDREVTRDALTAGVCLVLFFVVVVLWFSII